MQLDRTAIIIALIASAPATLAAIGALVVTLRTGAKVEVVRHEMNSMKDALVKVTRSDALQEGHTAGVQEEKDRKGAVTKGAR